MTTRFDYNRQAWVKDGRYVRCGHVNPCDCYGTAHVGEPAPLPEGATLGHRRMTTRRAWLTVIVGTLLLLFLMGAPEMAARVVTGG